MLKKSKQQTKNDEENARTISWGPQRHRCARLNFLSSQVAFFIPFKHSVKGTHSPLLLIIVDAILFGALIWEPLQMPWSRKLFRWEGGVTDCSSCSATVTRGTWCLIGRKWDACLKHGMGDATGLRSWRSLVKQCLIFLVDYISVISYLGTTVRAGSHTVVTDSAPLCFAYRKLEQEKLFRARGMSRKRVHPSSFRKIRELEGHFLFNVALDFHLLLLLPILLIFPSLSHPPSPPSTPPFPCPLPSLLSSSPGSHGS